MSTFSEQDGLKRNPLDRFLDLPFPNYVPTDGALSDFIAFDQYGLVRVAVAAFNPELNTHWDAADIQAFAEALRSDPYAPGWVSTELTRLLRR